MKQKSLHVISSEALFTFFTVGDMIGGEFFKELKNIT